MTAKTETITTTIEIRDPWGKLHRAHVTWMPERMDGVDAGRDNMGMTEVAWADEDHCPVYWELDPSNSCARLREWIERFTGDIERIARASQVESIDELEPGTYTLDEEI